MTLNSYASAMAFNLRMAIENGNGDARVEMTMADLVGALGGNTSLLMQMTPDGRLLYLIALLTSQPEGS